ncbi:unnamed protein product [Aureobasidium uvarum]|uniref:Uncharacterized protein n=1 Tax=Aureobasidium uvarum TaxID=2773716 RepID=A0A9N8PQZ1_9PEZI|nr:unnamed protein product [Aureobasidium uvarum]
MSSTRTPMQRLLLLQQSGTSSFTTCLLQPCSRQPSTRFFSTSPRTSAGVRKSRSYAPRETGMKQPSQKSFEVMKKEQMKNIDQMPNDVGLIPATFIMPTGNRLPSLTADFSTRFALEKHRAWLRIKEIFGYGLPLPPPPPPIPVSDLDLRLLHSAFFFGPEETNTYSHSRHYMGYFHVKPRADFQTSAIPSIAKSLYQDMYTAFASGNLAPVAPKLCENVHMSLEQRIQQRSANVGIAWTLHNWTATPKIVSHKYMPMSLEDNKDKTKQTTIQQVCVRMQSLQSLKKVRRVKQGNKTVEVIEEGSSAAPKEVVEYLVVQRLCKRGKMGPWMVWGTTTESDPKEALAG